MFGYFWDIMGWSGIIFPHNAKRISSLPETSLAIWIMWWNTLHTMHMSYYLLVYSQFSLCVASFIACQLIVAHFTLVGNLLTPDRTLSISISSSSNWNPNVLSWVPVREWKFNSKMLILSSQHWHLVWMNFIFKCFSFIYQSEALGSL